MGIITSRDTRRISFHNDFAINPILVQNAIEDCDEISINSKISSSELDITETPKRVELHDEGHEYWARRIDSLKGEHQVINKIIEKEYEKTLESTNKLLDNRKVTQEKIQKMKPCFDWQAKILRCYEDNPNKPLVCSSIVQAFKNCVTSYQLED